MKNDKAKDRFEKAEGAKFRKHLNHQHKPLFGRKNRATIRVETVQPRSTAAIDRQKSADPPIGRNQPKPINVDKTGFSGKRKLNQMEWTIDTTSNILHEPETATKRHKGCYPCSNESRDGKFTLDSCMQALVGERADLVKLFVPFALGITSQFQSVQHEGAQASPDSSYPSRPTILVRRQVQADGFEENELDAILLAIYATNHSNSLTEISTRMTGTHIDPAIAYQQKQKEIKARGGRKGQYGVVISAEIFKDRERRGWHKHQNVPTQEQPEKGRT